MLDPQRIARPAPDDAELALATVEGQQGWLRILVGVDADTAAHRLAIMADIHTGFGREPPLAALATQQAQLVRANRQADAVGGTTADEV